MIVRDADLSCDLRCDLFIVAGKHDDVSDTGFPHGGNRGLRVFLQHVIDDDVSEVLGTAGYMNDRSGEVAFVEVRVHVLHELAVSDEIFFVIDHRADAAAGDLLDVTETRGIDVRAVCFYDGLRDRVVRAALRKRGDIDQLIGIDLVRVDVFHGKCTFREGSCFVEHDGVDLRQGLQVVAALDEDAAARAGADPAEERERDGYDKCAWAGDYEEDQASVDTAGHAEVREDRADHSDQDREGHDDGGIDTGEFGDKLLGARFLIGAVFDQLEDARHGAVFVRGRGRDLDGGTQVDRARIDGASGSGLDRQALARQCRGIQRCGTYGDHAVDRDFLAGLDEDGLADQNLRRIDFFLGAVTKYDSGVRADVHHRGDRLPALSDGDGLEQFTDLVEEHNSGRLRIFSDGKSTCRGDHHEEFLV